MSLIGSLEDLGLGDILQIIHLSQKSGVLSIRGEAGEGRLVFQGGLVRLASLKGDPEDLRALVVDRGFVSPEDFDAASTSARETGCELPVALANLTSVSVERIESLRRECIERAVGAMFSWSAGDFSFDVGAEDDYIQSDMSLSTGVNAQYLAMESLRVWDEGGRGGTGEATESPAAGDDAHGELNLDMSAEEMFGVSEPEPESTNAVDSLVEATAIHVDPVLQSGTACFEPESPPVVAERPTAQPVATHPPVAQPIDATLPPVVVIAPELNVLEWVRGSLSGTFASVHIFQRSQEGLGRIRQYLARAQAPILLVSPRIEGNPLSGILDAADFVSRLQGQAPRMPILWLVAEDEAEESLVPVALPTVIHPAINTLSSSTPAPGHEQLAERVSRALVYAITAQPQSEARPGVEPQNGTLVEPLDEAESNTGVERLMRETRALSEASTRGEILPLVIRFAADSFARVAIFMVRGDLVLGMAQHGIDSIGGPTDVEMRALRFERTESSWFREVIETRRPVRATVRDAGDQRVCDLIGGTPGGEAYIAPIMSGENVVAILYADNGSRAGDLAESSGLEVVLQHAGLALDRAALERALAEVDEAR